MNEKVNHKWKKPKQDDNGGDDGRRRRAGATTLGNFAHRKGVTKAIQDFQKRKDKKRVDTAKALRQYKKTMKQQGYSAGQGASRKRKHEGDEDNDDEHDAENDNVEEGNNKTLLQRTPGSSHDDSTPAKEDDHTQQQRKRHKKANPFAKALLKSKQHVANKDDAAKERKQNERNKKQKIFERRKRSQNLRQRTAKGQPVMKHVIHDILRKLEREKQQDTTGSKEKQP